MSLFSGLFSSNSVSSAVQGGAQGILSGIQGIIGQFHMSPEDSAKFNQQAQELIEKHFESIEADVQSARQMEMSTKSNMPSVLTTIAFITFAALASALIFHQVAETLIPIIAGFVGYVAGWCQSIINFYFGSSQGSSDKTDAITNHLETLASKIPGIPSK